MGFEFGIFDSFDLGDGTPGEVIDGRLRLGVEADRLGYAHYHATEHHGTDLSVIPSPNLFLAALSQRTERIRMGAMVYVLPAYEPLRLAEEIAVVDHLTGGRLDLGVGSGVSPFELGYFGVPGDEARARYDRSLTALLDAWTTGVLRHPEDPEREHATLSVLPVQQPYPPLWYASSNQRTAEWAGRHGINFLGRWNDGEFVAAVDAYWAAGRAGGEGPRLNGHVAGTPRIGPTMSVLIGGSDAEAEDRFASAQEFHARRVLKLWHEHGVDSFDAAFDAATMIARGTAIVGTADTVRDRLIAQLEQTDVNMIEAQLYQGDMGLDESLANLRAFAGIMPDIRAAADALAAAGDRVALEPAQATR
ncbi:LLM class flavin-dependent oxidoreductase [Microbacterium sp. LRZ72]|uniref:LLM class flavin-dependent oxidoreductase n=1 Tax=Microbacterium sp. LRZ72 TaxID=2942481 RepID=UPI0029BE3836|nr:LLM class flavin-dependent oxidoreductase [Microbacterium sp. LRZ72]MDX2377096.1 LLM class flavin-dependent oxidoreductase [Microbacterium sp. LRZ72]